MARLDSSRVPIKIEGDTVSSYPRGFSVREKKLAEAILYSEAIDDDFSRPMTVSNFDAVDGTIYTGAAGEVLTFHTGIAAYEWRQLAVASPAVIAPYISADGLELQPVAAGDNFEMTNGISSRSRCAYTVGSIPNANGIFLETKINFDDISGVTALVVGFRKAEAYQADWNDYDELCSFAIGVGATGRINMSTILNNAATSNTNTGITAIADGDTKTLRIEIANSGKAKFYVNGTLYSKNYTFDAGEVIVPFCYLDSHADGPDLSMQYWRVGQM